MYTRRITAYFTLICLVAACAGAGGSGDDSSSIEPTPSTAPTDSTVAAPDTTNTPEPDTSAPAEPTPTTTTVSADPSLPTIEELAQLEADGEIDTVQLAVSEFAAIFGVEVDGALPVALDPTLSADPSSVIELIDALASELTDNQRQQIEDALAIDTDGAVVLTNEDIGDPDLPATPSSTEPTVPVTLEIETEWNGFRSPDTTVDPRLVEQLRGAQTFVMGSLGGTTPRFNARFINAADRDERQSNYAGWARTRTADDGGRICNITIVNYPAGSRDEARQVGTVIHEYFHCWHGANFDGSVEDYWRSPRWVKEGLAMWVQAEAVDNSGAELWATRFLTPTSGKLYPQTYGAVGFFWQVGYWAGGSRGVWDRIPDIADQSNSSSAYEAAIAGIDPVYSGTFGASSAQLNDVGEPWVFTSPFGTPEPREIRTIRVETAAGESTTPGGQSVTQFDFVAASVDPVVITTDHAGSNMILWRGDPEVRSALFTDVTRTWCLNGPCICEDGTTPADPISQVPGNDPRLLIGLTGGANDGARFKTSIVDLEDACNPPTNTDLSGEWIADPDAIRSAFNEAYSLIGVNVTGVSGQMRMTLRADGLFTLTYDKVQLNLDDEFVGELIVDGTGKLEWREAGGTVTLDGEANFNLTIETPQLGGAPIQLDSSTLGIPEGMLTFDADVEGNSLTVSNVDGSLAIVEEGQPNIIVFPTEWIRSG